MAKSPGEATAALTQGAVAELLAVGQAKFTMEGAAGRSFYSVGSLYERWPDRSSLLAYLAQSPVHDMVANLVGPATDASSLLANMAGDHDVVALAGEILLSGHTDDTLRGPAVRLWETLLRGLRQHMGPGMAWYVGSTTLGNALLELIGVHGPLPSPGWSNLLLAAINAELCEETSNLGRAVDLHDAPLPVVPAPSRQDPVALALIEGARLLLAESGVQGTSTRDIAASAGVTTGALYRRYPDKSRLIADVFWTQLEPAGYGWTWDLVQALATDDPYGASAQVMADRIVATSADSAHQRVLMQVGVAARSDPVLQNKVHAQISAAVSARGELVGQLQRVGIIRRDVDADCFAWAFQTLPVGLRALTPLGIDLDEGDVRAAMRAIMRASAEEGS